VGNRVQLTAPSPDLKLANREVEIDSVKHPHLDHGYAVTSHSSQGQTADRDEQAFRREALKLLQLRGSNHIYILKRIFPRVRHVVASRWRNIDKRRSRKRLPGLPVDQRLALAAQNHQGFLVFCRWCASRPWRRA
jgi:hypothetical protein